MLHCWKCHLKVARKGNIKDPADWLLYVSLGTFQVDLYLEAVPNVVGSDGTWSSSHGELLEEDVQATDSTPPTSHPRAQLLSMHSAGHTTAHRMMWKGQSVPDLFVRTTIQWQAFMLTTPPICSNTKLQTQTCALIYKFWWLLIFIIKWSKGQVMQPEQPPLSDHNDL